MNPWVRRFLYLLFTLVWLAIMLLPLAAFVIARNGQLQLGDPDGPHTRVFLLLSADAEGLGLERARRVRSPEGSPDSIACLRTTVSYWMWDGSQSENTSYCQCLDETTGQVTGDQSPSCLTP